MRTWPVKTLNITNTCDGDQNNIEGEHDQCKRDGEDDQCNKDEEKDKYNRYENHYHHIIESENVANTIIDNIYVSCFTWFAKEDN